MSHGNIQHVTNECEKLLAHALNNNIEPHYLESILQHPIVDTPKILRNLTVDGVDALFRGYAHTIRDTIHHQYGAQVVRAETINHSNFAPADLLLTLDNQQNIYLECKFGAATLAGIGIQTLTNILGAPAFTVPPSLRQNMVHTYLEDGTEAAHTLLTHHMEEYTQTFNTQNHTADSGILAALLTSSGGGGNTIPAGDYLFATFHPETAQNLVTFTDFKVSPTDTWDTTCNITKTKTSLRLTYRFTRPDNRFYLTATYNNKNSTYVYPNGELVPASKKKEAKNNHECVRIPSLVQCGIGSYNVFVRGHHTTGEH